jgi:formamidopyrimidine-DNA glycosylase
VPELPETETIARDLDREISGRAILHAVVRKADVLRDVTPKALEQIVTGKAILRCWRRAKLIVLDLSGGERIVVQPRFTGAMLLCRGPLPDAQAPYSTLHFALDDGRDLHYRDIRRLGTLALMSPARFDTYVGALGVEPLDPAFTDTHLSVLLRASKQPVKKVLMNQRAVVGIGNIYANEACWRAGLDPSRRADSVSEREAVILRASIVDVLTESIAARGTSFRDYVDASGGKGDFERALAAYGRGGQPCLRCGARLIETHAIDGRSTVLCAGCQR